jgi:hypothetical protein
MPSIRRLALAVSSALLLAGPAAAVTITPDPVNHQRDGGTTLDADVTLVSSSGSSLSFQLTVNVGGIIGLDFSFLGSPDLGGPSFNFTSGGSVSASGSEIGGTATDFFGTEVQVVFDETVDAGESSGIITIDFASTVLAGYQGAITFDTGVAADETYDTAADVPEPHAWLLVGSTVAALSVRRRRD